MIRVVLGLREARPSSIEPVWRTSEGSDRGIVRFRSAMGAAFAARGGLDFSFERAGWDATFVCTVSSKVLLCSVGLLCVLFVAVFVRPRG